MAGPDWRALPVLFAVVLAATAPAAAQSAATPVFEVSLDEDGSARITLILAFDLTTDSEIDAFRTLQEDERAKIDVRDRFERRMQSVANGSEERVGREMRVHDAAIELSTPDAETGLVTLSVAWENLAAVRQGHLVITEPFASGFTPDRRFVVRIDAPEGYRLTTARPTPATRNGSTVAWEAGTKLTGFRVAFAPAGETPLPTPTAGPTDTTSTGGQPGFGLLLGGIALLLASLAAAVRR